MLHLSEEQLKAIDKFKEKDWKPVIVSVANLVGYKKSDYKGASKYLVNQAVRTIEKNEKTKETLTILAEHPSIAGLIFSVITQFSGKAITVNENGVIKKSKLPDYYTVGDSNAEKIVCAFLYWLFALGVDEASSKITGGFSMNIKFNVPGQKRKELAKDIGTWLGSEVKYCGAPSFAYSMGFFNLDREGYLSCDDSADGEVVERLLQHLYDEGFEFEMPERNEPEEDVLVETTNIRMRFLAEK